MGWTRTNGTEHRATFFSPTHSGAHATLHVRVAPHWVKLLYNYPSDFKEPVIPLTQEQRSLLTRGMVALAAVFVVTLVIGTFNDLPIAQAIYNPGNPVVIFLSSMGLLPMVYPVCLLLGTLVQRSLASNKPPVARFAGAAVCALLALVFGALITRATLSMLDGFGGLVGAEPPETVRMAIGAVVGGGLCAVGYGAGKANDAKDLARRVIMVIVVMLVSFALVEIVKSIMARPRPRTLFAGYEGLEFCPWYSKFSGAQGFMDTFGIGKDGFKSFPSGHSLQAAAFLTAFYGLSLVYPSLRSKLGVALGVEVVYAVVVMACRMILGAHFLSDVSMGAFISVVSFLVLLAWDKRAGAKAPQER